MVFSLTDIIDSIHTIFQAFLKDAEQFIHSDGNNDTNYSTDQTWYNTCITPSGRACLWEG